MNVFDILLVVNLVIALAALVRSRPGALIVSANLIVALRALSNIEAYGQPNSETFLPLSVFSQHNFDIARVIFIVTTALLGATMLLGPPPGKHAASTFVPLPRWLLILLGLFTVAQTLSSGTIFTETYTNQSGSVFGVSLGGVNALAYSLILYELVRRALTGAMRPRTGFLLMTLFLFLAAFSKGSTGLATGYEIAAIVLLWSTDRGVVRRAALVVLLVGATTVAAYVIRGARVAFFERGTAAISDVLEAGQENEEDRSQTSEGLEARANGTQYACHTLECISLYEAGVSREWRSVYGPFIYTFEPAFLLPWLSEMGVTRPKEAAWELADYYIQGGGIYLLGELYWNGGYLCVVIVFGLLMVLTYLCDTRYRASTFWLMMCCQFAPGFLMGAGYGFAQVSRGAFNCLLVVLAYRLSRQRKLRWRREPVAVEAMLRRLPPRPPVPES